MVRRSGQLHKEDLVLSYLKMILRYYYYLCFCFLSLILLSLAESFDGAF